LQTREARKRSAGSCGGKRRRISSSSSTISVGGGGCGAVDGCGGREAGLVGRSARRRVKLPLA
jgi:hypothetical protein